MAFRFVAFAALLAYAYAGVIPAAPLAYAAAPGSLTYAAPVAKAVVAAPAEDYDPNPQYSYGYDVQDSLTGDSKSQSETRNGDVVQGSYSVVDPDGTRRTVDYTADPVNGFNAVVNREPGAVAVKAIAAAPAIARVAAPIAYASPATYATFASPAYAAAPFARVAAPLAPAAYAAHSAPIAYSAAPAVAKVAYSSPAISYHL